MRRIIDLTATIKEDMIQNAPFHPRAPVLLLNQRHDVLQWYMARFWTKPGMPPLFDGLPPEAGMPGKGHGQQSEQVLLGTHMGTHIDAPLHFDNSPAAGDATSIPACKCIGDAVLLGLSTAAPSFRAPPDPPDGLAADQLREGSYEALFDDLPIRDPVLA